MKKLFTLVIIATACAGPAPVSGPVSVSADGYDRSEWKHWIDVDKDCQDTRQEVLIRQSEIPVKFNDERKCRVSSGQWTCPYTDTVVTDPSSLDIDHVISLKEAHLSGGAEWDAETKEAFANDLDGSELVASTASSNRSKGSRGPEEWMPSRGRCEYLSNRVSVQLKWDLQIPESEARFILRVLTEECLSPVASKYEENPTPSDVVDNPGLRLSQDN